MIDDHLTRAARAAVVTALVAATMTLAAPTARAAPQLPDTGSAAQARATQWWLPAMGVTKAHRITRGKGVRVCLIDAGVDPEFPDLRGTRFVDGTDLTGKGSPDGLTEIDLSNHGTSMATFIAGQGRGPGHTQGILGTAPDAEIIPVSTDDHSKKRPLDDSLKYCADHGAQVISYSRNIAPDAAGLAYAQARDVVLVAATGNDGDRDSISGLAGDWGVLGVGGVDKDLVIDPASNAGGPYLLSPSGKPSDLSDRGGVAVMGPYAVAATTPHAGCAEEGIYGPALTYRIGGPDYDKHCGTSDATAIVAGIVALVRAAHPDLNAANVINRILRTAIPPTDGSTPPSPLYGFGIADAHAAITADIPTVEHNPLGSAYTRSRGIWDPRVTPQRPEPPAHSRLPATDWHIDTPATNANALHPTTSTSPGHNNGDNNTNPATSTTTYTLALAALGTLLLTGIITLTLALTRRRREAPPPPPTPPPPAVATPPSRP